MFSSANSFLAYSSNTSSIFPNPSLSLDALAPVWEEWASSTITANFLFTLFISVYILGNFCNVVIIIFLPSLIASNKSFEVFPLSILTTVPGTWSNW